MMHLLRRCLVTLVLLVALAAVAYLVDQDRDTDDDPDRDEDPEVDQAPPGSAPGSGEVATVRTVHDGDSFVARLPTGEEVEVRMIGINAPEFGECLHRPARTALVDLIGTREIVLEHDVTDRDRYGRMLRYVLADGVLVNTALAEQGLALATSSQPDVARQPELDAAQRTARDELRGIWNPDACGPAASRQVRIVEVQADPPGRDQDDLNGELVVVSNDGDTPVDMTGWKLRDDSTRNRYWFPQGFSLGPGRRVTVHVGTGADTDDTLFWHRRHPVWDNARDTALLLDPQGNAVSFTDVPTRSP